MICSKYIMVILPVVSAINCSSTNVCLGLINFQNIECLMGLNMVLLCLL